MDQKDEFVAKLSGPRAYKKQLEELFRRRRLIRLEIEQLFEDSLECAGEMNNRLSNGVWKTHVTLLSDTECERSPCRLHGLDLNRYGHEYYCIWCEKHLYLNYDTSQLEKAYS